MSCSSHPPMPLSCHTVTADLDGTPRCAGRRGEHRGFHPVFGIVPAKAHPECPTDSEFHCTTGRPFMAGTWLAHGFGEVCPCLCLVHESMNNN